MTPRIEQDWSVSERQHTFQKDIGGLPVYAKDGEYTLPEECELIIPLSHYWAEARIGYTEDELREHIRISEVMVLNDTVISVTKRKSITEVTADERGAMEIIRMFYQTHDNRMKITVDGGDLLVNETSEKPVSKIKGNVKFFSMSV
jgi:hypothetical protein